MGQFQSPDEWGHFMNWWQGLILGIIQGLTEYLPVSSSGHLALTEQFFGLRMPISVDVLLHLATLIPTIWIFRKKIGSLLRSFGMLTAWFFKAVPDPAEKRQRLVALGPYVLADGRYIATVLTISIFTFLVAYPQKDLGLKFQPRLIAGSFLFTALLLLLQHFLVRRNKRAAQNRAGGQNLQVSAPQSGPGSEQLSQLLPKAGRGKVFLLAVCLGLAQGIAALPGISRSGMTISVALILGMRRKEAGELSFIISIPLIIGALLLDGRELLTVARQAQNSGILSLVLAFLAACLSGFIALHMLLILLRRGNFYIFAIYLLLLSFFSFHYFR